VGVRKGRRGEEKRHCKKLRAKAAWAQNLSRPGAYEPGAKRARRRGGGGGGVCWGGGAADREGVLKPNPSVLNERVSGEGKPEKKVRRETLVLGRKGAVVNQ